jgi:RNA polymerase subunit RPABC4/transcription elongation factor Spt4
LALCPNCQREVSAEAKFCRNCGANLSTPAGEATVIHLPVSSNLSVRAKILLILWPLGFVGWAFDYLSYFMAAADSFYWTGVGLLLVVVFGSTEIIYEDAKAVNKAKGRKVLDATLWSLVTFLLWEVAIPWYVFSRRKNALES